MSGLTTVKEVAFELIDGKLTFEQARGLLTGVRSTSSVQVAQTPEELLATSRDDPGVFGPNDTGYLQLAVLMGGLTNDQMTELTKVMTFVGTGEPNGG